jgi:hypothetical protein
MRVPGSLSGARPSALRFAEAATPPCASCDTSPCCRMLPIGTMPLRTFRDVDEIRFLLNFDRIRVFLAGTGRWHIYYDTACRELDPETYDCRVHGTLDQPEE